MNPKVGSHEFHRNAFYWLKIFMVLLHKVNLHFYCTIFMLRLQKVILHYCYTPDTQWLDLQQSLTGSIYSRRAKEA